MLEKTGADRIKVIAVMDSVIKMRFRFSGKRKAVSSNKGGIIRMTPSGSMVWMSLMLLEGRLSLNNTKSTKW